MNAEADAQGLLPMTCQFCGLAFEILHPTTTQIQNPICESCKRAGRGEGCEDETKYPLSRAD